MSYSFGEVRSSSTRLRISPSTVPKAPSMHTHNRTHTEMYCFNQSSILNPGFVDGSRRKIRNVLSCNTYRRL